MRKTAKGTNGKRGIGLSSLAAIGTVGFLVGSLLSGTYAGGRIAAACFGHMPSLSASDSATGASCFAVLKESIATWRVADGIAGLAQKPLFNSPEKLKLTDGVLKAHNGNPNDRKIHNVNLRH